MDPINKKQAINSPEVALASEVFDQFCNATTLKSILGHYRQLCELLKVRPNNINQFYPKLKAKLRSWKAQALWKKFDQRANHKCYNRGKACPNTRVLIIGGGPCGLRTAIEAQLLGAKVVVIEKRDRMSRNNVLHLWPFVIQDLRGLGAKKFFGKFCAGSIDHISIRQLQCILLKVALILGVEFHESVSFDSLIQPPQNQEEGKIGWKAKTLPVDHPVSQYEFDVLIGADGKRNTLEGFKRKEFRGKLAIAITANFINKRTEAEARVEEISGVAFIFNQKFFKELYQDTGIDLENIVYYKDDTHYFVMTAKKHSLIDKGVILQDHADTAKLLAKENVDREALMLYAREAAEFSTEYQMMNMEFAVNHYGQPDVAMFDFTSMYAAENASRVLKRHGHKLLMILVGDSLLEPFWPTGSGCARGFLSSLDAGWAIKGWGALFSPLEVIAERESIYRLLGQTTPENLNRDYAAYTLDPHTRYPNLNIRSVIPIQVCSLLDTDDPESIKQPVVQSEIDVPKKRRRRDLRIEAQIHPDTLLRWLQKQVALYDKVHIEDMGASFKDGLAICAIIHRYRPDLINFYSLNAEDIVKNNQLAFDILEKELNIPPIMTGEEMAQCDVPDTLTMFSYLTQIYEAFRGDIPYIKHPKLEPETEECSAHPKQLKQLIPEEKAMKRHSRSRYANENVQSHMDKKDNTTSRRSRKRRSTEKMSATMDERQKRLDEIEKHRTERMKRRQYLRKMATQQFYKSMQMLQSNAKHEKDGPFEDYSIFLYRQTAPDFKDRVKDLEQKILYPDRQPKIHIGYERGNVDEEFSGRIKDFEDKLKGTTSSEKKPRDLLRAIGKIEKTDWNVKEIEKKIEENKMGRGIRHDRVERVPKWSREQFLARQIKMEKRGNDQRDTYSKYADIDNTLKNIGKKIREGSALGHNKVSAMAEQFSNKSQDTEPKLLKSNTKSTIVLPVQGSSEMCHFCNKRVYLMERLSAEGKFFHRGCFRCEYCSTSLRIGNHTFDREKNGGRFYCTQHFGLSGTMKTRAEKKRINLVNKENVFNAEITLKTPEKTKTPLEGIVGLDLLDRGQTPERIEFENLAEISDPEEAHSQMDEDEWTDRNFGVSTAEMGSSDDISDMSDSDEEDEIFEEAIDQPLTTEGTLELAKNWTLRYSYPHATIGQSDTGSNEYEDSSDEYTSEDDESGTATEDEEDIRARELRKQEVWLKVPPRNSDTDTGSETEVKHSQGSVDPTIAQESLISFESKVTIPSVSNMNANGSESLFDRNNLEELLESFNKVALTSGEIALSTNDQDIMTSADKNGTSFNVIAQTSESVICVTNSMLFPISTNADDSISNPNRSLIFCTNILGNNQLDKENYSSEYESFVDENVQLDLNGSDNRLNSNCLQNGIVNVDMRNFKSNSIDLSINVNDSNLNDLIKNSLDLSINNLKEDFAQNDETGLKQVAKITLADAIPCTEVSKDLKVSDNETILNVDDLPGVIASSLNRSRNYPSSSLSETYRSIEISYNNSTSSSHLDDLVEYAKFNLSEEVGIHKHLENICSINQNKDNDFIDKNKNIIDIDDSNNIHMSDVADEKIDLDAVTPMIVASVLQKSVYPTVTVTSPSPTQEIQLEELSLETSKLLVPQESHYIPDCDSAFDKLKRDLQQRKARNKTKGNGLRPLSTENARLKMSKYFTENKKVVSKCQSARNEEAEETFKIEMVKLDIKPRLSGKINAEKMLKYFNKTNSSNNCDKYEVSNTTEVTIKQDEQRNLEIDIEDISDKTINTIDRQFNQIEIQNGIACIEDNGVASQSHLSVFEICNDKRETAYDNLDLIYDDLVKLHPHINDIDIHYVDRMTSNHNVPKLEDHKRDVSYSAIDLETISHTDIENDQSVITNMKKIEKINTIDDILKDDINSIHKEKEVNVNLNNNMINNNTIKKEDVINIDLENSVLNNRANEEKKENLIFLDRNVLDNNNKDIKNRINILDKNSELYKNNTHINTKLIAPLLLKNNRGKVIKHNMIHKSDMILNKSASRFFCKNIRANSKSLPELRDTIYEDVSVAKIAIVDKVMDAAVHIVDMKVANDNSIQNCIREVPKRLKRESFSNDINFSQNNATAIPNLFTIFDTKLSPPEIPVRKKSAKRSLKPSYRNQDVEYISKLQTMPEIPIRKKSAKRSLNSSSQNQDVDDLLKLQNQTVDNIAKLYNQNDVSNIQSQDTEKLSEIKAKDIKDVATLQSQDINNIPKIYHQDVSNIQSHDIKNIHRLPKPNIERIQNENITNISNLDNEIKKDSMNITIAENRNIADVMLPNQSTSIPSIKDTHYSTNRRLPNKPEEPIKSISYSSHSKKDKCIIS